MMKLFKYLYRILNVKKIGCITLSLEKNGKASVVKQIADLENQRKALEFAKKLHRRKDYTDYEKAQVFNLQMLDWAKTFNKTLTDCSINCLRELAVVSLKAEQQCADAKEIKQKA